MCRRSEKKKKKILGPMPGPVPAMQPLGPVLGAQVMLLSFLLTKRDNKLSWYRVSLYTRELLSQTLWFIHLYRLYVYSITKHF